MLRHRRSCNLLTRDEMLTTRTPTTPTISSIIAGVQCQEAVKHLHGMDTMRGGGWIYEGISGDSYPVKFQQKEDCYSHDVPESILELPFSNRSATVEMLFNEIRSRIGENAQVELPREIVSHLVCPLCTKKVPIFKPLSNIPASRAVCADCDGARSEVVSFHIISQPEDYKGMTLSEIGLAEFDIVFGSTAEQFIGFELTGDKEAALAGLDL